MKKIFLVILACGVIAGIIFFSYKLYTSNNPIIKPNDKSGMIVVTTPIKNSEITSPLTIAGRARGNWFFEAQLPLVLTDKYGNTIAEGHATAQDEWTTTNFVRFVGSLQFDNYIKGSQGTLIIKKDNPSGLPQNDDSIHIPVILK